MISEICREQRSRALTIVPAVPRALAEIVATELVRAGVDAIFGVPGGGPNLDKVGAATRAGIRFVLTHTETAACVMAGTYGLLTGQVGVAIATRGPGVSAAVNGVAQATLDRAPLVFISDTVPAAQAHRVPHQRLDQVALMTPVTKWSGTLGETDPAGVIAAALRVAKTAPAGAVHLDFDPTSRGSRPPPPPVSPERPHPEQIGRASELVAASRRPVWLIGAAAIPWTAEVRRVVAATGAPALQTYQAKGLIPDSSPHAAGLFTNGALERPLLDEADLLIAVGLDPVEPIPAAWDHTAPVLILHPWEIADPYFEPTAALIAPIAESLAALPEARSEWPDGFGRVCKERAQAAIAATGTGLTPHQVVAAVADHGSADQITTVDAGAHFLVVMPLWNVEAPRRLLISNGLATMGYGVPAAIGAALARPDSPVVALVGDGGLGMSLAELETIARLGLKLTVVVFNDSALSLVEVKQGDDQGGPAAVRYAPTDFAAIAVASGMQGRRARSVTELQRALAEAGESPTLVDCAVDATVYRHVIAATRG